MYRHHEFIERVDHPYYFKIDGIEYDVAADAKIHFDEYMEMYFVDEVQIEIFTADDKNVTKWIEKEHPDLYKEIEAWAMMKSEGIAHSHNEAMREGGET